MTPCLRVLLGALAAAAGVIAATPGVRAQNINEPEVEQGQTKLETFSVFRSGLNNGAAGDTRELHNLNYYRGLTDVWLIKGFLVLERPAHDDYEATAAVLENTFEILNAKKTGGFGLAWFTGISVGIGEEETNAVIFGPIVRLGAGPTSLILNPSLERTFGRNHEEGVAFVYGWQVKHEMRKGFWLGIEGFGKLPDIGGSGGLEEHQIGPLLTFEWEVADKRTLTFETGVLFGMTEATADRALKFQITYTY